MSARSAACAVLLLLCCPANGGALEWYLPVRAPDRRSWLSIQMTAIGRFGLRRKARPGVPPHLHTGADIKRPGNNYLDEPVLPAAAGVVISRRDDGPFAQVIVEHHDGRDTVWTVYEHIAGITAVAGDTVNPAKPLARFMTGRELDRYGRQFDHLHFEVMRAKPLPVAPSKSLPMRLWQTYALACFDRGLLDRRYYDPKSFFDARWNR